MTRASFIFNNQLLKVLSAKQNHKLFNTGWTSLDLLFPPNRNYQNPLNVCTLAKKNLEGKIHMEFIRIFKLRALDSPYTRIHTLFELTWVLFD